ncbi:MAG: ArsA family ATPase [Acidimicrobiales bacterium]
MSERPTPDSVATGLAPLLRDRSIVICCGSGGAGKTTTSAAIALAGALGGLRTCVVTIDPARRLADALGVGLLTNEPKRIEGSWPGELYAVMLDAKRTFDDLVERYSADPDQAARILGNRLYRNLTSALSGTQEYMAAEKLYELNASGAFDLVVVDTPPTRNALDFLDAPGRLTRFLENRVFRLLLMPTRMSLKALTVATQALLRTISKVAGAEIVEDAMAFFRAFEGMEEGFRERARGVEALLGDPGTAFLLVAAPRRDSVAEARFFADRLAEAHQPVAALVVNRLHPDFKSGEAALSVPAPDLPAPDPVAPDRPASSGEVGATRSELSATRLEVSPEVAALALAGLRKNLADLQALADEERGYVAALESKVDGIVVKVPYLSRDVHDLDGLLLVAGCLVGHVRSEGA